MSIVASPGGVRHAPGSCAECTRRGLRLFCNLGDEALKRLDEIAVQVKLPARATVYAENETPTAVYVVCEGQLKLSTMSRDGRVMILRLAVAGDILGLSAVLNNTPHEVTAETLEPTLLKRVRNKDFVDFMQTHVEVGDKTAKVIAKEYREVFLDARRLALSGSASGKLARSLLDWARTSTCSQTEMQFTMALTHEDLASLTGTSRETVTRLLNQFERERLIARRGKTLYILSPVELESLTA